MKKKLIIFVLILIVLDQWTKWLAETHLTYHVPMEVLPFFSLYLTYNKGIAFSWLSDFGSTGLIVMTLVIICFMIYLWRNVPREQQLSSLGFAFVIAGAVGNLIDRVHLGYVIDFFLFHTQSFSFAVFNVADAFITIGAACILVDEFIAFRKNSKNKTQLSESGDQSPNE